MDWATNVCTVHHMWGRAIVTKCSTDSSLYRDTPLRSPHKREGGGKCVTVQVEVSGEIYHVY